MMIQLRREKEQDYFETENLIREAFWNHYTPGCSAHHLVHIMRNCPVFVPELEYQIGETVMHPKFGEGIIENIEQLTGSVRLHIRFQEGTKVIDQKWLLQTKYRR